MIRLSEPLLAVLRASRRLAVLTGAGMSAESGVPVFRGSGGLWEGYRPEELATPEAFAGNPERVWRWYRWRLDRVAAAEPHDGYHALVELEERGGLESLTVITQNVDGLHRRAGCRNVVELHGNLTRARCSAGCGRTAAAASVDPARSDCGCGHGRLRPDVVWFGESPSAGSLAAASAALARADLVWVVGTSSLVYPAAALPALAAERGVTVVEVNPDETPFTAWATGSLRAEASEALRQMAGVMLERARPGSTRIL